MAEGNSSTPPDILVKFGILPENDSKNPGIGASDANGNDVKEHTGSYVRLDAEENGKVALLAIRRLIESGKLSMDDASDALTLASQSAASAASAKEEQSKQPKDFAQADQERKSEQATPFDQIGQLNESDEKSEDQRALGNEMEKYRTRHIALQFSYDGTDFSGFAQNIGREGDNSVEKALFAALEKTRLLVGPEEMMVIPVLSDVTDVHVENDKEGDEGDEGVSASKQINGNGSSNNDSNDRKVGKSQLSARTASKYSRCGRTDKGVHAHGQVVALYLKSAFSPLARRAVSIESTNLNNDSSKKYPEEASGSCSLKPGDLLQEDDLPKNALDGLECFVPPRKKTKPNNKKKTKNQSTFTPSLNGSRDTESLSLRKIHEYDYPRILNNILPPSIRILSSSPVTPHFSARFSCSRRTYRYFFPRRHLDLDLMAEGLGCMMGRHDFRNFCKMNCEQVWNFERVLKGGRVVCPQRRYVVGDGSEEKSDQDKKNSEGQTLITIEKINPSQPSSPNDLCHVEITGQAFLWHQIRCIMSVLFYVGNNLEPPSTVRQLLDVTNNPRKPAYEMASETGLVLHECGYPNLCIRDMGRTVRNMWEVTKVLEQRWEMHAVAAERARDELTSLGNEGRVRWDDLQEFMERIVLERERKKKRKSCGSVGDCESIESLRQSLKERSPSSPTSFISWKDAIVIVQDLLRVYPYLPNGRSDSGKGQTESSIHEPLLERSKGTTYEEKIKSILGDGRNGKDSSKERGSKRRERYEKNIIKKRKTKEEDKLFYDHMLKQGGSSIK